MDCPICLDSKEYQEFVTLPCCKYALCEKCKKAWEGAKKEYANCPNCSTYFSATVKPKKVEEGGDFPMPPLLEARLHEILDDLLQFYDSEMEKK